MQRLLGGFLRIRRLFGLSVLFLLPRGLVVFGQVCNSKDLPQFTFSEVFEELVGEAALYRCKVGAVRVPGSVIITSCRGGSWTLLEDPCKPITCAKPVVQDGVKLSASRDSYNYGNSILLECKTGFFMIGNYYIVCEKNGTWVPKMPSCKKITPYNCGAPIVPKGYFYPLQSEYKFGEVIDVYCNQNYSFIDETTKMNVHCQGYNQWDPPIQLCLAKTSPDTTKLHISNGRIIKGKKKYYTIGDEVTVKCNAGYTLLGTSTVYYIGGNKWSPNIPTCILSVFLKLLVAASIIPVVIVGSKILHKKFCSPQSVLIEKREQKSTSATKEDILLPETLEQKMAKFEPEHQKENGRPQEKQVNLTQSNSELPSNTTKEAEEEANPTSSLHEEGPISEGNWVDSAYILSFSSCSFDSEYSIHVKRAKATAPNVQVEFHSAVSHRNPLCDSFFSCGTNIRSLTLQAYIYHFLKATRDKL